MNLNSDFASRDNLVRDARDYTGVLDFNLDIPDNHVNFKSVESGSALRIRHRAANLHLCPLTQEVCRRADRHATTQTSRLGALFEKNTLHVRCDNLY